MWQNRDLTLCVGEEHATADVPAQSGSVADLKMDATGHGGFQVVKPHPEGEALR